MELLLIIHNTPEEQNFFICKMHWLCHVNNSDTARTLFCFRVFSKASQSKRSDQQCTLLKTVEVSLLYVIYISNHCLIKISLIKYVVNTICLNYKFDSSSTLQYHNHITNVEHMRRSTGFLLGTVQ